MLTVSGSFLWPLHAQAVVCPTATGNVITVTNGTTVTESGGYGCDVTAGESLDLQVGGSIDIEAAATGSNKYAVNVGTGQTANTLSNAGSIQVSNNSTQEAIHIDGTVSNGIDNSGSITSTGYARLINNHSTGAISGGITNSGSLTTQNYAIYNVGTLTDGLNNTVDGNIVSSKDAVTSTGTIDSIVNDGLIKSNSERGIGLRSGSITGTITNQGDGEISGGMRGIEIQGQLDQLNNLGSDSVIKSPSSGFGVVISDTANIVTGITNEGSIAGGEGGLLSYGSAIGTINNTSSGEILTTESHGFGIIIDGPEGSVSGNINNQGTITGGTNAGRGLYIIADNVTGEVSNSGTISGGAYSLFFGNNAVLSGGVDNSGLLDGAVEMGSSALTMSGTNGRANSSIHGSTNAQLLIDGDFSSEGAIDIGYVEIKENGNLTLNDALINSGSVAMQNDGTLHLPAGEIADVTGNYKQSSDGVLRVAITDSDYGKLSLTGSAEFVANAKINVDVSDINGSFSESGYADIVTASTGITASTFSTTDNSVLFDFEAIKDNDTIDLLVRTAPSTGGLTESRVTEIVEGRPEHPGGGAAKQIDALLAAEESDVKNAFIPLTTEDDVIAAVAQTLPLMTGDAITAGITTPQVSRIIQARASTHTGLNSGDQMSEPNIAWFKAFGQWSTQDSQGATPGYDSNSSGFVMGVDRVYSASQRSGIALSYAQSELDNSSSVMPHSADVDSISVIGYASHASDAHTEYNVQMGVGHNSTRGTREILFANQIAAAKYSSSTFHLNVGRGKVHPIDAVSSYHVHTGADLLWIHDSSYTETGAGGFNLQVDTRNTTSLKFAIHGGYTRKLENQLNFRANAGLRYDVLAEQADISSTYTAGGTAFTTEGLDVEPLSLDTNISLSKKYNKHEVSLQYGLLAKDGLQDHSISFKWRSAL